MPKAYEELLVVLILQRINLWIIIISFNIILYTMKWVQIII